jgi:vacuolar-type H+-ATPase subunit C/Vma6
VYKGACKIHDIQNRDKAFIIENSLDKLYFKNLFDYCKIIPKKEGAVLKGFLSEYSWWTNLLWILRLKRFFNLKFDEVKEYIIPHPDMNTFTEKNYGDMFDAKYEDEILSSMPQSAKKRIEEVYKNTFDKEIDYEDAPYLKVSVCIRKILKAVCGKYISSNPNSIGVIPAFFELKLTEINNLNTIIEGFRLNMTKEDIRLLLI